MAPVWDQPFKVCREQPPRAQMHLKEGRLTEQGEDDVAREPISGSTMPILSHHFLGHGEPDSANPRHDRADALVLVDRFETLTWVAVGPREAMSWNPVPRCCWPRRLA